VDNLASIVADGFLWPDAVMVKRAGTRGIGNNEIKTDRLALPVSCHPGTMVGQYVPFYFCPRSVMLYVISKRNHPNVAYREGQGSVVHIVADLQQVVEWANANGHHWAFTAINAANRAADFYSDLSDLSKVDWVAVNATSWVSCRDQKMAEFLVCDRFPWELVRGIGVYSEAVGAQVVRTYGGSAHRPQVKVKRDWYY
jgi:hypothetical protein